MVSRVAIKEQSVKGAYRSSRTLSVWVRVFLGVSAFLSLASIAICSCGSTFFEIAQSGVKVTQHQGELIDSAQAFISGLEVLCYIVTGLLFIVWFSRVRQNVDYLGVTGLKSKPLDCTMGFVIPVVALYKPLTVSQEIWKACTQNSEQWQKSKGSVLLNIWWTLWLLATGASRILDSYTKNHKIDSANLEQYLSVYATVQVIECLNIAAALAAIFVVQRLTDRVAMKYADVSSASASTISNIEPRASDTSKVCPSCDSQVKDFAKFCTDCGTSFEESEMSDVKPIPAESTESPPVTSKRSGFVTEVKDLPHFPFSDFDSFKTSVQNREVGAIIRRDGALQWASGELIVKPEPGVTRTYWLCRFVAGAFPSAGVLLVYSICTAHWWLLLSIPLCWVAAYLFDPLISRLIGILHWLPLLITFGVFGWSIVTGQQMWLVLTACLLVIWLALKIRLDVAVRAFARQLLSEENFCCIAWSAGWLTISIPSEQAEYSIDFVNKNGKPEPTAHFTDRMQNFYQQRQSETSTES